MSRLSLVLSSILVAAVLFVAGLFAYATVPGGRQTPAAAQSTQPATPPSITVSADGQASAAPDQATISVGVQAIKPTAAEALADANAQVEAVLAKLDEFGIPRSDVQTSGISVFPTYSEGPTQGPAGLPQITGYRAVNQVTVMLKDLAKVGQVIDAVVAAGANQINGVQFSISDDSALQTQALEAAVKAARPQADSIAAGLGLKTGEVLAISEEPSAGVPIPAAAAGKGGAPVEPGQLTKYVRLEVTFALVPAP